jgi:hypothetical protein
VKKLIEEGKRAARAAMAAPQGEQAPAAEEEPKATTPVATGEPEPQRE